MAQTAKKAAARKVPVKKAAVPKKAAAPKAAAAKAAPAKKAPARKVPAKARKAEAPKVEAAQAEAPVPKAAPAPPPPAPPRPKRPAPPKPFVLPKGKKMVSPFPAKFLEVQRKVLIEERATYLGQAESLQAEADSLVDDIDPGDVQFDEESGEGDTLAIERERDLALSAQARQAVEEIDHALTKFDNGSYGICEVSGEPIPEERLEAIPWAREKVEYKIGGLGRR